MSSVNASSEGDPERVLLDPDQKNFSEIADDCQITASRRLNSNTDLSTTNETRGNVTVEAGQLSVNEKNLDWEIHTHHNDNSDTFGGNFSQPRGHIKSVTSINFLIIKS